MLLIDTLSKIRARFLCNECNDLLSELGNCVGAAEDKLVNQLSVDEGNRRREGDKLVYQLSVDEGTNRRREGDNIWRFER